MSWKIKYVRLKMVVHSYVRITPRRKLTYSTRVGYTLGHLYNQNLGTAFRKNVKHNFEFFLIVNEYLICSKRKVLCEILKMMSKILRCSKFRYMYV